MSEEKIMKALIARSVEDADAPPSARLELTERPVPQPAHGKVLVRMEAASANPSDLLYLKGEYGVPPAFGKTAGFEGCGRVVKSGGGIAGWWLGGKRVACVNTGGDGVWAEYVTLPASSCLPIPDDIPADQAATLVINPYTAMGLLDRAEKLGSRAIIMNAAASQLGKLVLPLAHDRGIRMIAVVRQEEQKKTLQDMGAEHVLVTADPDYATQLSALARELKARVFLDAVAGPETAKTLQAMPGRSTAIVYGRLHKDPDDPWGGRYPVGDMIFRGARIEGYWLTYDMRRLGLLGILRRARRIAGLFRNGGLKTTVQSTSSLADYPAALDRYAENMSAGKPILMLGDGNEPTG